MIATRLPDLFRYRKTELTARKLSVALSFALVLAACALLLTVNSEKPGRWLSMGKMTFWIQGLGLLVYGAARTGASVSGERAARTWDFQRLTPMSSWRSAVGRLLGAPLLGWVVAVAAAPFGAVASFMGGYFPEWCAWQAHLACSGFFALSLGLFISAHAESAAIRSAGWAAPVAGLVAMATIAQAPLLWTEAAESGLFAMTNGPSVTLFGQGVDPFWFASLSCLAFGGWLFAFASWRIGHDYLEKPRSWAGPGFVAFFSLYVFGLTQGRAGDARLASAVACLPAYASALWTPEGEDSFGDWIAALRSSSRRFWPPAPWALNLATALAVGIGFAIWTQGMGVLSPALTALRDLCLVQSIRTERFKRPELVSALALTLVYLASGTAALVLSAAEKAQPARLAPITWLALNLAEPSAASALFAAAHAFIGALVLAVAMSRARQLKKRTKSASLLIGASK